MKNYYVYTILNSINYKIYVGQTNNPKHRWYSHKSQAKSNKLQYSLYRSIRKYGIDFFQFTIIEVCSSQEEVDLAENYWIQQFDSRNNDMGYNLAVGGNVNRGWHHTNESKKKISEKNKGKIVIMSNETKEKISIALKGHILTEETKEKISKKHIGKIVSIETRCKISKSKIGSVILLDTRIKMSKSQKNRQKLSVKLCNLSKLTYDIVKQIRSEWNAGNISQRDLGRKYNVDRLTIWRIVNNITWKNL